MIEGPNGPPQGQQVRVNLADAKTMECPACSNMTFMQVYMMKQLSALVSPTGKQEIIPLQLFACSACGTIPREFLPGGGGEEAPAEEPESSTQESSFEYTGPSLVE